METREVLAEIKQQLEALYGERLKGVLLYGSEARGEARPDSDIDVMVLLEGPFVYWHELKRIIHVTYPIQLQIPERHLQIKPVETEVFDEQEYPLYQEARKDGVLI